MNGKVWTRAFCLLAAALIMLTSLPVLAESFPYTAFATDSVRLRGGPSSSAAILTVIKKGDAVTVTGEKGQYKIVEYENRKGYVVETFLAAGTQEAPAVTASPEVAAKYPSLTNGSTGPAVKALQEALKELGFHTRAVDSKYGAATASAVKSFQEKNKLTATGTADSNMQALLFEGKPVNSRGQATSAKTLPVIEGVTIRPGDQGDAVKAIQQALTDLKLYTGAIDGKYGSKSQDAIKAFQKANSLKADGIIGTKTYAALGLSQQAAAPTQAPQVEETSNVFVPGELPPATYPYQTTVSASVNLRKRAATSAMRILTIPQGDTIEVLEETGSYLKVIYRKYTGFVQKDFVNIPEQYLEGKSLKTDQAARVSYETLAPGTSGVKVRALQQALTELGYYNGKIDGNYGSGTNAAIKALQTKNNLRATGVALPELQQLIYEKRVRNSKNRLVYVKTLPPIDGVTMQQGDYGDAVYELHQMLVKTKLFDQTVGYEYTSATTKAVRAFQKDHSIKVTGKVDAFTLLAIKTAVGVSTTPAANEQAANEELTQDNVVIINNGTRGLAVTRLQQRLVELKYYNITPDGEYNNDDIVAVQHFQRLNSLPITGVADLATQQVMYTTYAIAADSSVSGTVAPTSGILKIGAQGEQVRALQSRLIALNFLTGSIDGNFGTQTAAAVAAFQKANSLKQDGIVGNQTTIALYSATAKGNTTATPTTPGAVASESLKLGSSGDAVKSVQQRLIALAYLTGAADGIYGPRTATAVSEFQTKNKLDADGVAGKLTIAALNSANAISKNVTIPTPAPVTPTTPTTPTQSFTAPRASEVRYANWFTDIRPIASSLRNVIIYDFISGAHYNFRFFSLGKHADGTTLTAADTATMNKAFGANNWTPRPVWVIFSDGRVFMASTHTHPHANDYVSGNDLNGHLCVHFPREMAEAELTGPYAVSHQNAILAGWDLTKNMAR